MTSLHGIHSSLHGMHARVLKSTPRSMASTLSDDSDDSQDSVRYAREDIEEDLFGFAVVSFARDVRFYEAGTGRCLRVARIIFSQGLVVCNILLQIFLLIQIKQFITAKAVHDIREVYDRFEYVMYQGNIAGHTTLTANGKHRGVQGFFPVTEEEQRAIFETMSADEQAGACRIALSQPLYVMAILLIWTVTCFGEVRKTLDGFLSLIYRMPTVEAMSRGFIKGDEADERVIIGLRLDMKVFLTVFIVIPRLLITLVLIWLGCRWLVATENFSDILLNAVALEFILFLKELFYATIVPHRNKRDLQNTKVQACFEEERAGERQKARAWPFFNGFLWLIFAMAWVAFYVYNFQMVLPDYKWDVHDVCQNWIARRFKV